MPIVCSKWVLLPEFTTALALLNSCQCKDVFFLVSTVQFKLAAANSAAFFLMLGLIFWSSLSNHWSGSSKFSSVLSLRLLRGCFCHAEDHQVLAASACTALLPCDAQTDGSGVSTHSHVYQLSPTLLFAARGDGWYLVQHNVTTAQTDDRAWQWKSKFLNEFECSDLVYTKLPLMYGYGTRTFEPHLTHFWTMFSLQRRHWAV